MRTYSILNEYGRLLATTLLQLLNKFRSNVRYLDIFAPQRNKLLYHLHFLIQRKTTPKVKNTFNPHQTVSFGDYNASATTHEYSVNPNSNNYVFN